MHFAEFSFEMNYKGYINSIKIAYIYYNIIITQEANTQH